VTLPGGEALAAGSKAIHEVAGNAGIRRIELGWAVGIAADWAYLVALLIAAYAFGGAFGVALLGVLRMIPPAIVAPFADVPVRRIRGDRALFAVNVIRAGVAVATAVVLGAGGPPAMAFALAGIGAAAGALVRPIQTGLMPALARSPSELIAANVTSSIGEGAGGFIGPLLGGAVAVAGGEAAGCTLAAVAFVIAALSVVGIRFEQEADARGGGSLPAGTGGFAIARAVRALRRDPDIGLLFVDFGGQVFVRGMLTTLIVVASNELLALGDSGIGPLTAAIGLGGFLGAFGALGLAGTPRLAATSLVALAFWGVPIAVIGAWPFVPVALAGLFVTGVSNAILDVSGFTVLQRGVPNRDRMAVFGLLEGMVGVGVAVGGLAGSAAVAAFGAQGALGIAGAILPIMAVATWPRVSRIDRRALVSGRELAALRAIPLFAPLPLTAMDRLAEAMRPVTYPAGEVLMRQGDPGDTYLAITDGNVAIDVDGRAVATMGPGDGIGEIALLRAVPRTATATALTDVTGYALEGGAFLAAVCGPTTASAAQAMVEERLAR
jgi:predicted MFS family arabinose efflux permease